MRTASTVLLLNLLAVGVVTTPARASVEIDYPGSLCSGSNEGYINGFYNTSFAAQIGILMETYGSNKSIYCPITMTLVNSMAPSVTVNIMPLNGTVTCALIAAGAWSTSTMDPFVFSTPTQTANGTGVKTLTFTPTWSPSYTWQFSPSKWDNYQLSCTTTNLPGAPNFQIPYILSYSVVEN